MAGAAKRDPKDPRRFTLRASDGSAGGWPARREYAFDATARRFDIAIPGFMLAIECQGGEHVAHMGHRSREGTARDVKKANDAGLLGWRVLYLTGQEVRKKPLECLDRLREMITISA